ncbi:C-type lectin BfL-2-like [Thamnophis elegans]|uniref:C-type lectin BfL-2-like n=1 Tax=Thamnophis elegans TaxID=35005 RepID=UPI001377041D|nr:C-type lectin BfL-2-like [Thamnophis elegans]
MDVSDGCRLLGRACSADPAVSSSSSSPGHLLIGFLSSPTGAKGYQCPLDWLPGNELCYKVFVEQKTWTDAEVRRAFILARGRRGLGGALKTLKVTSGWAERVPRSPLPNVASLSFQRRIWGWSDRSSIDYFSWDSGEPNKKKDEFCVYLWAPAGVARWWGSNGTQKDPRFLKWNDVLCDAKYSFICQCKN